MSRIITPKEENAIVALYRIASAYGLLDKMAVAAKTTLSELVTKITDKK
jgi:hypothetical protein